MLYLDRYYPEFVAQEIHQVFSQASGEDLEKQLLRILVNPVKTENDNPRIPTDLSWISEMYLQVRVSYAEQFGVHLLDDCLMRNVSSTTLSILVADLYGERCFELTESINEMDIAQRVGQDFIAGLEEIFEDHAARLLSGVADLYDVFAAHTNRLPLRERIAAESPSQVICNKLLKRLEMEAIKPESEEDLEEQD